ncbi:MAG: ArnT family glycosyltransferase [Chthoniobacterales bacterium]
MSEARPASATIYFRAAVAVIICGSVLHLAYATHLELVGDEAYYWLWSRHPDICYLDKGPMIAWLIRAGTTLFGNTVFGVRFFAVVLASGTGLAILLLSRRLFSDRVAFWAVVISSVAPLFAVGASLMTIDTVYVFFWSWAAVSFWWAKDQDGLAPWVSTGVLVGLGILSKYTATIELISFTVFCLWHRPSREHLQRATFWTMVSTALLFFIPAIVWNIRHHWPTSDWLLHRGALDESFAIHPTYLIRFLSEQAGVVSPLLFVGLICLLLRPSLWRVQRSTVGYGLALFLPLFGFYLILSLHYAEPPNWPAAAYVGGFILLAAKGLDFADAHPWGRRCAIAALILALVETGVTLETRWLHLPHRMDPLDRARGSRNLATSVAAKLQSMNAKFIIADNYMTAALLSFYLPGQPETYVPRVKRPLNQLELWSDYDRKYPAGDALIVAKRPTLTLELNRSFSIIQSLGTVAASDGDRNLGSYHLFLGHRVPAK